MVALTAIAVSVEARGKRRTVIEPEPTPTPSVSPTAIPSPMPTVTGKGYITFKPVDYYTTKAERVKIKEAEIKVNQVIQSQCFVDFMKNRKLIQTDGRSNAQVIAHIQGMRDTVPVNMYYRKNSSAVAYREPPEKDINLNRAYFYTELETCEWSATMVHEAMHSLGEYDHDYQWNRARSYSVPYSVGGADTAQGGSAFDKCCY
jgi:hypothetical protein